MKSFKSLMLNLSESWSGKEQTKESTTAIQEALDIISNLDSDSEIVEYVMNLDDKTFELIEAFIDESVAPKAGEIHNIDWDGKSRVHVSKVVGDDVHLVRLNRPKTSAGQPVRDEDKTIMKVSEFNKAKLKSFSESIKRPNQKVAEEAEQIEELSKSTLGSYVKKASSSIGSLATSAMHSKNNQRDAVQDAEYYRRAKEPENAKRKYDQADEHGKASFDATEKRIKRQAGVTRAVNRLTKEDQDLDQIQELSKSTLASYRAKATGDADRARKASKDAWEKGDKETDDKEFSKNMKRTAGIAHAAKRMTAEGFDHVDLNPAPIKINEALEVDQIASLISKQTKE